MCSLQDLHDLTKSDWKEMDVPLGLGKRLAAEVKIWKRERQNHGFRNSLEDLVAIALSSSNLKNLSRES